MKLKQLTALALAALLAVPAAFGAAAASKKADAIRAHRYTIMDATTVQYIVASGSAETYEQHMLYDLDFDGMISVKDATTIQMHCAGLLNVQSDEYLADLPEDPTEQPTTSEPTDPETSEPTEPASAEPTTEPPAEVPTTEPVTEYPTDPSEPTNPDYYLSLDYSFLKMGVNERITLHADTNAERYRFVSTNEKVLTVDENGNVTPRRSGSAKVICDAGYGARADCEFMICPEADSLALNAGDLALGEGEWFDFDSYVNNGAAAFRRDYSSDDESVIKIERAGGMATAVGTGKTTVRCTLANGVTASCEVEVYRMPTALRLNAESVTLAQGEQFDFNSYVVGGGYAYIRLYHSLDESIASIEAEGGLLTAKEVGDTQIYCELNNGVRAYADVHVSNAAERIRVLDAPKTLKVGETATLHVAAAGGTIDNRTLTVDSNQQEIRVVSAAADSIVIQAMKRGNTPVTVTSLNGVSDSFPLVIEDSVAACIDVSTWQGSYIDFQQVKASGIDYVILRLGYGREYDQIDNEFINNYDKATKAGLKVGAYWFSYAMSPEEAYLEADACLHCLGGRPLDMPIYYDLEYDPAYYAMTGKEYTQMALNFCAAIEQGGYRCGVYSSVSDFQDKLDHARFLSEGVSVWNAHWSSRCTIECDIWQYSEKGSVPGIYGDVDMNWIYNLYVVR